MLHQLKRWIADPVENTALQVPRALVASGVAAVLDVSLLVILVERLGLHPAPAAVVGYLAGGVLQYVLCSRWVFPNAPRSAASGFVSFLVLSLVGLVITWVVMVTVYDWAHLPYPLAKCSALGLSFGWNFLSRKFLLFRPAEEASLAASPEQNRVEVSV